ncbi:6948_t:CDS:2, partial [Funneliformis caledonium]
MEIIDHIPEAFADENTRMKKFYEIYYKHYKIQLNQFKVGSYITDSSGFDIAGRPYISIARIILIDSVTCNLLTPVLPLLCLYYDKQAMFQLTQIFHALNKAVVLLQEVYNQRPLQISSVQRSFLYINSFQTLERQMLEFNYKSRLYNLVFHVERNNDYSCTLSKDLLVKFVQDYEVNAHEACAEMGIAFQLFSCYRVLGGWKVVVMEYIKDSYSNLAKEYNKPSSVNEIKKSVKEKVEKMQ